MNLGVERRTLVSFPEGYMKGDLLHSAARVSSFLLPWTTFPSNSPLVWLVFPSPVKSSFFPSKRGNWQPQPIWTVSDIQGPQLDP